MKIVKRRNMENREMKLAIGNELQTLFYPIVNTTTKQSAEETMKKALTDIDGALLARRAVPEATGLDPPLDKYTDVTFGIYKKQGGQLPYYTKIRRYIN